MLLTQLSGQTLKIYEQTAVRSGHIQRKVFSIVGLGHMWRQIFTLVGSGHIYVIFLTQKFHAVNILNTQQNLPISTRTNMTPFQRIIKYTNAVISQ